MVYPMSGHSFPAESTGQLELIADYGYEIGENPLWHPFEKTLYWTDIPTGRLFRYYPKETTHEQVYAGRPVGGFTVQTDGSLLLFIDRGTIASWRDGTITELITEIPSERDTRFNDVTADPYGRVFCGTTSSAKSK
jgi:D-xylono/L-arabinono-1,4-lactonase